MITSPSFNKNSCKGRRKVDEKNSEPLKLVVSRHFDAPAEAVFDAWLDEKALGNWLFATPDGVMQRVEVDPRVGGEFVVVEKRGELLVEHIGTYEEIARPRRLVFVFGVPQFFPGVTRVTVDIVPQETGCQLTLLHEGVLSEYRDRTRTGWTLILDGLSSTLFADREVVSTRLIDAPRERVIAAFSDPEQLAKWWGPNGFTNTIKKFDFREGGDWHLTMHGPDGTDYRNESVFVERSNPGTHCLRPFAHDAPIFDGDDVL